MRHFYSEVFLELSRYFFDDLWSRPLRDWCDLVLTNKYYTPVIGYWTAIWFLVTSSILLPKIIIIDRRTSLQISAEKEHNLCCIRFKLSFSSKFTQFFPLKKSPRWKVKAILTRGEKRLEIYFKLVVNSFRCIGCHVIRGNSFIDIS